MSPFHVPMYKHRQFQTVCTLHTSGAQPYFCWSTTKALRNRKNVSRCFYNFCLKHSVCTWYLMSYTGNVGISRNTSTVSTVWQYVTTVNTTTVTEPLQSP